MRKLLRGSVLPALAPVLLTAILAAAFPGAAQAQSFTRVADVESIGGYTIFNQKATFWYYGGTGTGFVLVERVYHDGTRVSITGQITRDEILDLWWKAYYARPWSAREVKAAFLNVDLPDTRMTYAGRYTQTIRAQPSAASLPLVSAQMRTFIDRAWELARKVGDSQLFKYEASGGLAGYQETVVITQSGEITVDRSTIRGGAPPVHKTGYVAPADLNELVRLCGPWWSFPDAFDWPPGLAVADGLSYKGTYSLWGYTRTVASKTAAREDPRYKAILEKVQALADQVAQQP
jgi:hypothetical protein